MNRIVAFIACCMCVGSSAQAADRPLPNITVQQGQALQSFLASGGKQRVDFAAFPRLDSEMANPVPVTNGTNCVLASDEESLHNLQFLIHEADGDHRVEFDFTLSPGAELVHDGRQITLTTLIGNRRVTQYYVWKSDAQPQDGDGHVVAFRSRRKASECSD